MSIDFFTRLGPFPGDLSSQVMYFDQLKVLLTELDTAVVNAIVDVVILEQNTLPTQGEWETAYTTQTSKSLPIPASAQLYWWNTTLGQFGGFFGTVRSSDTAVYGRNNIYAPGNAIVAAAAQKSTSVSVTYDLGEMLADHPAATVTLVVKTKLYLSYQLTTTLSSGSGSWGADFLIDGVKAGTLYYSVPSDRGIMDIVATGIVQAWLETPTLDPGTYVIQAIFGRTNGTSPTVAIGGATEGVRLLMVRGVVADDA